MADKRDIMYHYDDDFSFFEPILGQSLAYSCADWLFARTLEEAQQAKFKKMLSFADVSEPSQSLIDLGCGWGSLLKYAGENGLSQSLAGITISPGQAAYCKTVLSDYDCNIIEGDLFDYLDGDSSNTQYDAAVSIGAFEHFSNPREFKTGQHIERYRRFFNGVRRKVRGKLALQTIVTLKTQADFSSAERKEAFKLYYFLSKNIFPNSLTPPLEDVITSVQGIYNIERYEVSTTDYAKTLDQWSNNLDLVRHNIEPEVYARFKKYFDLTSEQYKKGALAISRFSLAPIR